MTFIQTLSFVVRDEGEFNAVMEEWEREGSQQESGPRRVWVMRDRDRPNAYLVSAEFSSYEQAMENSARPETDAMARRLGELTESGVEYGNYDLVREQAPSA